MHLAFVLVSTGKIYIYDLRSGSSPVNTRLAHKTSVQSLSFQSSTKVRENMSSFLDSPRMGSLEHM